MLSRANADDFADLYLYEVESMRMDAIVNPGQTASAVYAGNGSNCIKIGTAGCKKMQLLYECLCLPHAR